MTTYDEVTYPSYPIAYTHPDRLGTVATLLGMKPAPAEKCRVLELGCSDGINLAAMAIGLPNSEFVGVDLAGSAIARGQALAADVGIKNLTLRQLDVMEMAPDYGQFDYIISHGVYTWVPQAVCDQMLAICKGSLAPQGVAYVSYNTFPGCHNRQMLREMMLFHNRDFTDPQQQMHQAFNLLKLLANSLEKETEPYSQFLKGELERLSQRSLESIYHDELATVFAPVYFHQFMDNARQHDLQFLGEADFFDMVPRGLTPKAVEVLDTISSDIVLREQYLDFMRGRHFRKTLLCHPDVPLNRTLTAACVKPFLVSTFSKAEAPAPNLDARATEIFQSGTGAKLATADPLARAVFWQLADNDPLRVPFLVLVAQAEERARGQLAFVPKPDQDVVADVAEVVWMGYRAGMIDLHQFAPPSIICVSERPVASPLARWEARRGDAVSTLHHRILRLGNSIHRGMVALLDGSRDRAALRTAVLQVFSSGTLDLRYPDGKVVTDMAVVDKAIGDEMEPFLEKLARSGVLMA